MSKPPLINPDEFLRKRVKQLRLNKGWTQEEFSEKSGISYKYAQSIEAGRIQNLRLKTIFKIACTFGIGIHELFDPTLCKEKPRKA